MYQAVFSPTDDEKESNKYMHSHLMVNFLTEMTLFCVWNIGNVEILDNIDTNLEWTKMLE